MFGLGTPAASNTKIFYANTSVDVRGLQAWHKPPNCSVVSMLVVGGGGGGGGGAAGSGGTAGGGGAASSIATLTIPALFLPNTLYVQVGSGGLPGTGSLSVAAQNGSSGINSMILSTPTTASLPNIILAANSVQPGGGGGSPLFSPGAAGSVPTLYPTTNNLYVPWGHYSGIVGQVGVQGDSSITNAWSSYTLSGGSGGVSTLAVNVNATALTDLGPAGYFNTTIVAGGTTTANTNGGGGLKRITPFMNSGGAGGGCITANTTNTGGNGGVGGYGCGGGGGARGGATSGLGGNGGKGGDGIVIISWV